MNIQGKRCSRAIDEFEYDLEEELLSLHHDLVTGAYTHGKYKHYSRIIKTFNRY